MTCPVCPTYSPEVLTRIENAGKAHLGAMAAIRRAESPLSVGRAVVMGPTFGFPSQIVREAELTAEALGFKP